MSSLLLFKTEEKKIQPDEWNCKKCGRLNSIDSDIIVCDNSCGTVQCVIRITSWLGHAPGCGSDDEVEEKDVNQLR